MILGRYVGLLLGAGAFAAVACGTDRNNEGSSGGTGAVGKAGASAGGRGGGAEAGSSPGGGSPGSGGRLGSAGSGGSAGTLGGVTGGASGSGAAAAGSAGRAAVGGAAGTPGAAGAGGSVSGSAGSDAGASGTGATGGTPGGDGSTYDEAVLSDGPVAYWAMNGSGSETDLTGNAHTGTYHGSPEAAELPNGDQGAAFDGESQYLSVPSHAALSIATTGNFTWEAWIRPDTLQFENDSSGYVDWMGKCEGYDPNCEWEARMYSQTNSSDRCNRLSAYAFNPSAGLGSGAYWEAEECGTIEQGSWYHVVGEYTTDVQSGGSCDSTEYPGSIDIWVNGVKWNQASHGDTGCMSQYEIAPEARPSPLNIGTMSQDAWFEGAIAKVAIYDFRLSDARIKAHYQLMTGMPSTGSCDSLCTF
jgi:hypothetical protein